MLLRGALLVVCAAWAGAAPGQRFLAVTQALSATREAGAIYVESVDFSHFADVGHGNLLPGAPQVLGSEVLGLHVWPSGSAALLITGDSPLGGLDAPRWWRGIRPTPFQVSPDVLPAPEAVAKSTILKTWVQPGGAHWLARASQRDESHVVLQFQPWSNGPSATAAMEQAVDGRFLCGAALPVPGGALAVVERGEGQFVAAMAWLEAGVLHTREAALPVPKNALDARPRAALVTGNGAGYVLFGGYDLTASDARTASWLVAFSIDGHPGTHELQLLGAPQEGPYALQPHLDLGCWCITREPGRDVAYATLAMPANPGLEKQKQYPLPNARGPLRLSANALGDVLAAVDQRVELWPKGARGERTRQFDTPVSAVAWSAAGPVIAEAGRIDLLDTDTLATRASVQCQSGEVAAIAEVPAAAYPAEDTDGDGLDDATERALGTDPREADTDHDGLHDGVDPEPLRPTISLRVPPMLRFNGDAAGQELHDLLVRPAVNPDARWQMTYSTGDLPWLRLYPATSYGTRAVYVGIDPQFHGAPTPLLGVLRAQPLRTLQSKADAPGREVLLAVRPPRQGPVKILWMLSAEDGPDVERLRTALSGPPLCFSHRISDGAEDEGLAENAVVVLGSGAAARGDVSQHLLVDYVSDGGALLVVPEAGDAAARDVSGWFSPLGFRIEAKPLEGALTALGESGPAMAFPAHAPKVTQRLVAPAEDLVVQAAGGTAGALVLRKFGMGRVAAVADAALLDAESPSTLTFAEAVFRWLGRAGLDINDLDGDGLPDTLEDASGNQALDPGETDRLNPDTDSDGLPDGLEDRNRNGLVDDGETDPRNPDSDGDGILDGADPSPCPALGAPRIVAASPVEGPAEGGTRVLITGANFDNTSNVFFGERPAAEKRLLGPDRIEVAAPPRDDDAGGAVDLRIEGAGAAKAVLPQGYRYTARSALHFSFASAVAGWKHDKLYNGVISVSIDHADITDIGQIVLVVEATPGEAFTFGVPRPGPEMPQAGRYLQARVVAPNRLMIVLGPGLPRPFPTGDFLRIPWEYARDTPPSSPIRIAVGQGEGTAQLQAAALAPLGGVLRVEAAPFDLYVDEKDRARQ